MRGTHSIMLQQIDAAVSRQCETSDVPRSLPDTEVVRRIRAGDGASFELLMRRHNQRVFRVVRSIVRDDNEAEDIVQESYVRHLRISANLVGTSDIRHLAYKNCSE